MLKVSVTENLVMKTKIDTKKDKNQTKTPNIICLSDDEAKALKIC